MLVDGIQIAEGSNIIQTVIDGARRGTTLPSSPVDGHVFELTANDAGKTPGIYTYHSADADWISNSPDSSAIPYDLSGMAGGTLPSGSVISRIVVVRSFVLKVGFEGCRALADTAPTSNAVLTIKKRTRQGIVAVLGSITFNAGVTVGTFAQNGGGTMKITSGEVLFVEAPASADSTLADVAFTFAGALA